MCCSHPLSRNATTSLCAASSMRPSCANAPRRAAGQKAAPSEAALVLLVAVAAALARSGLAGIGDLGGAGLAHAFALQGLVLLLVLHIATGFAGLPVWIQPHPRTGVPFRNQQGRGRRDPFAGTKA